VSYHGVVVAVASVYLIVCLAVGLWPARQQSDTVAGYVAGDRALGLLLMYFITGATIFSAFTFLGMPGLVYKQGAAAFYILSYGILGFVPFYFLGPRAARVGRVHGFVTQGEMLAHRFGNRAIAFAVALISLIGFVPYIALQVRGAGLIANVVSGGAIPVEAGAAAVYLVVLAYVWKSGLMGVGWTNVLQGLLMLGMAWALGLYVPHAMFGGIEPMFDRLQETRPEMLVAPGLAKAGGDWTWSEYSSAVLVSMIGFSCWPHLFMKAFTARDDRTLRRSVVLYPTFLLFQVPILLLGFAALLHPTPPPEQNQVVPHLLLELGVPAVVVGLFSAGALAAAMGGDAIAHAAASIAVRDGAVRGLGLRLDPLTERAWIRAVLVVVLAAAYWIAVGYSESLVWLLLFAYGPITQFMPGLVAGLYSRRATAAGVLAGLAGGIAVTLTFSFRPTWRPLPLHEGVYGLAVNVLLLVLVSLAAQPRDRVRDEEFLRVAGQRTAATSRA
jgi:SSS family solute:Na+ symporter